jgi:hypothetical protein
MSDNPPLPRVVAVEPLEGSRLRLTFTDGLVREVDLSGELWGPMAEPLLDPDYFGQVRVDPELGTVVWPNGFDLDPDVLHGDFEPASHLAHH